MQSLRRALEDRVARRLAFGYLSLFLVTLAWAVVTDLRWSGPDASMAFIIPLAAASPTASAAVATLTMIAGTSARLDVLASTPVLLTAVVGSAFVQASALALAAAWLRRGGSRTRDRSVS